MEQNLLQGEVHAKVTSEIEAARTPEQKALAAISTAVEKIKVNYPLMVEKKTKAVTALSKIQVIASDEQDELANNLLVKCRATFTNIEGMRKESTSVLDDLKKDLMEPEKAISPTIATSEYSRVKKLRDGWANKKLLEKQAADKLIKDAKDKADEKIRIKEGLKTAVVDGMFRGINALNESIKNHVAAMTLENWEVMEAKMKLTPSFKEETYNKYFEVIERSDLVTSEEVEALLSEAKKEFPYEKAKAEYLKTAEGTLESWRDTLPGKKESLLKLKNLQETNPIQAASLKVSIAQDNDRAEQKITGEIANNQAVQSAEIKSEANNARLNNEFNSQVQSQQASMFSAPSAGQQRKKKIAIITAPPQDIVNVLSKALMACYSNPKFEGHVKRDKQGNPLTEDGNPVYNDWAATILNFYANNSAAVIKGIEVKEIVSTVQKA